MMNPNNNKRNSNQPDKKPKLPRFGFGWIYLLILMAIGAMFLFGGNDNKKSIEWSVFQTMMEQNAFSDITVNSSKLSIEANLKQDKKALFDSLTADGVQPIIKKSAETLYTKVTTSMPSVDAFNTLYQDYRKGTPSLDARVSYINDRNSILYYILNILPFALIILFWFWMMRRMSSGGNAGGGVFNVGKSRAQLFDKENKVKVTFKDVAGLSGAKEEVEEIVHFLKEPETYTTLGGKIPKGALLVGPPGTGKTLLAKAVAGEANVPFFSLSGSDFVEMFVGVGASRVRDLFKTAKEKAPCIVFIDEIDAVGRARGKNAGFGGNDERENTLNQLLTEMDGFGTNSGVIILAATNRVDILDKALLRAGRFDRQINVDLPELNERKEIFQVHMRNLKMDDSVDLDLLARQTPGFSGADIANVCNEAALIAARESKTAIQRIDFMNAVDRIVGGLEKKTKITTPEEKRTICLHEAGHATISWLLEHAHPLVKVTIVPRGRALGAAWYLPEERQITTTEQLNDEMCALLGGRAAEEVCLGCISTGAANDLERVTRMAKAMVAYFGMSKELPNINYQDNQGEYSFTKPFSEETARLIDKEILKMINESYDRAKRILTEYKAQHQELADLLYEREVIYTEDVERILGKRKWQSRADKILAMEEAEKKAREEAQANEQQASTADSTDTTTETDQTTPPSTPSIDVPQNNNDSEDLPPKEDVVKRSKISKSVIN